MHGSTLPAPVGSGQRQFGEQDIETKFRGFVSAQFNNSVADRIVELIHNIDAVDDVSQLTALLKPEKG